MCGIAGYIAPLGTAPSRAILERMCDVVRHRGPDSCGYYLDGPVALGMRRLKIIDLATRHEEVQEQTEEQPEEGAETETQEEAQVE